jgi:hypothetical protein
MTKNGRGRPRKSLEDHQRDGTFRRDRHGHLLPAAVAGTDHAAALLDQYGETLLFGLEWGQFLPPELDVTDLPLLQALHAAAGGEDGLHLDPGWLPTRKRPSWLLTTILSLKETADERP